MQASRYRVGRLTARNQPLPPNPATEAGIRCGIYRYSRCERAGPNFDHAALALHIPCSGVPVNTSTIT